MKTELLKTDVLIIGGGTAGCYAAITLGSHSDISVIIAEKANVSRSGCLAAGVNALNAYITDGHVPQDYVDYASHDADGIVREDLLLSICERLNSVTRDLEKRGLVILKDENGNYVSRGWRNIKINGENIKPLLAKGAATQKNVKIINHLNITDLATVTENGKTRVVGAYGFSVNEEISYYIEAKAVLIATGGAAGLYRPNNPGFSRHKMWYPPFNTGAGYAMGILAGAEMTTFEMRFIALRCKDTIAPTGTIAQGVGAKQVNAKGEIYETKYGLKTSERCWGTVEENRAGNGPCFLATKGISSEAEQDLYKAYLNMAPSQTLKWLENGVGPASESVEVEGTEPYIVGGHTASGFWVNTKRETTISGLFAAGDVAGGAPQKYVTGALAEGEIAAESIAEFLKMSHGFDFPTENQQEKNQNGNCVAIPNPRGNSKFSEYENHLLSGEESSLNSNFAPFSTEQIEEAMQKIMDEYAGGIATGYRYNESRLILASQKIAELQALVPSLKASDMDDLLRIYEVRERLIVCQSLIAHLRARKETRWHSFGEHADYPQKSDDGVCYVNSLYKDGEIKIITRPLVKGARYEHQN
ncbi:MAG: adenylyl-sulfate reductase subunit alpha [Treponema sp.]|nr:adenylyl-sulfate reductase subunit alpha [Treponema sp.]